MFQQERIANSRRFTQRIAISEAAIPVSQRTSHVVFVAGNLSKPGQAKAMLRIAFDTAQLTDCQIDAVIRAIYAIDRSARKAREPDLVSELYKMQAFDSGACIRTVWEKTIVDTATLRRLLIFDT